jgi:hypothetical protein
MPIFNIKKGAAAKLGLQRDGFGDEAKLRDFFAANLEPLLGARFLAKEYPTTDGRMDTLGIDENNAPVIIEYEWKENEEVLSQHKVSDIKSYDLEHHLIATSAVVVDQELAVELGVESSKGVSGLDHDCD